MLRFLNGLLLNIADRDGIDIIIISTSHLSKRNIEVPYFFTNPLLELRGFKDFPIPYYYLDLRLTEERLLHNMEPRTRAILKNFKRKNRSFYIRRASTSDFNMIMHLFKETQKRVDPLDFNKYEIDSFLKDENYYFFISFFNDEPMGCIASIRFQNTGCYWISYTKEKFLRTNINSILLWHGIKVFKEMGVIHFDCGDASFSAIGSKEDRISKFKRNFGGQLRYKYKVYFKRKGNRL